MNFSPAFEGGTPSVVTENNTSEENQHAKNPSHLTFKSAESDVEEFEDHESNDETMQGHKLYDADDTDEGPLNKGDDLNNNDMAVSEDDEMTEDEEIPLEYEEMTIVEDDDENNRSDDMDMD